jgi:hypothetical protein
MHLSIDRGRRVWHEEGLRIAEPWTGQTVNHGTSCPICSIAYSQKSPGGVGSQVLCAVG